MDFDMETDPGCGRRRIVSPPRKWSSAAMVFIEASLGRFLKFDVTECDRVQVRESLPWRRNCVVIGRDADIGSIVRGETKKYSSISEW